MPSITEHFVEFSEAKALRELGFNDPCMAHYGIVPDNVPNIQKYLHPYPLEAQTEHNIIAPTYEQAFEWLRNKDRMFRVTCVIQPVDSWDWWTYTILMEGYMCPFDEVKADDFIQFESYESARLDCLKHMIKIITQKSDKNENNFKRTDNKG